MNAEQLLALNAVKRRQSIFLSGSAGTGKSFTLGEIIRWAHSEKLEIGVTASTGCAAYLIRGRTIHSYLGIGLAKKTARELAEYVKSKKPFIVAKIKGLDILVIDEISMISSELMDKISEFLSIITGNPKPFGGIQIVLTGDFAQLKSVDGKYCFHSAEWKRANIENVVLTQIMRQDKDEVFKRMLEELRWGLCTKESLKLLRSLKHTVFKNGIIPTILYSTNIDVDTVNQRKYTDLLENGARQQSYKTTYSSSYASKSWASSIKIPEKTDVCVGAQVVLTWNVSQDDGLINGSRGVVTALTPKGPQVKFVSGLEVVIEPVKILQDEDVDTWVSFIPLKLAYALTIHKSQGMTLDAVIIDLGDSIFEYGQAYTALSRARSLDSIRIISVKRESFKTHKEVVEFYGVNKASP
jgi:ATP-dependent DNA helicase PIF1